MLLTKEVEVTINSFTYKHYMSKGYDLNKYKRLDNRGRMRLQKGKTNIIVKIEDLPTYSKSSVDIQCDNCGVKKEVEYSYYNIHNKYGKYYCQTCSMSLFRPKSRIKTMILKGKSFKQYCIDNDKEDLLNRWDNLLNPCHPEEVTYSSAQRFWFKCPRGIHESELKSIQDLINKSGKCKQCNSFAQWGIDNISKDFLELYWDYSKNLKSPWDIGLHSTSKVYINCQIDINHDSYHISCSNFINGRRCSLCKFSKGEIAIYNWLYYHKYNFVYEMKFDGLVGYGKQLLSYDFFIPELNLLIEFQSEFHDGNGNYYIRKDLKKRIAYDNKKRKFAQQNNIELLEIWYYDYDNINEILLNRLGGDAIAS